MLPVVRQKSFNLAFIKWKGIYQTTTEDVGYELVICQCQGLKNPDPTAKKEGEGG